MTADRRAVLLALGRFARRVLLAELAQGMMLGVAAGAVLGIVIGLLGRLLGWPLGFDAGWAEAMFGAMIGLLIAWSHRSRFEQIAARLDDRYNLAGRLLTAAECIADSRQAAAADCVITQAAEAVASLPPRPPTGVELRRPMLAAIGALLLLAGAQYISAEINRPGPADRVARAVTELTPSQRAELAEALRRKADELPAESARLGRAARAIEAVNETQLRKLLAEFVRRGVTLRRILPASLANRAELPADEPAARPITSPSSQPADDEPPPAGVPLPGEPTDTTQPASSQPAAAQPGLAEDWDALRRRASAQPTGEVPPQHRRTVERFYREP